MANTILASTWAPRGELPRLQRLLPQLRDAYLHLVVVVGPGSDPQMLAGLPGLTVVTKKWGFGWASDIP